MNELINYIDPKLFVVVAALYVFGMMLKDSQTIADKYIPIILGVVSCFACGVFVAANAAIDGWQSIAMIVFDSMAQGIVCAGVAVYANQIFKQLNKE